MSEAAKKREPYPDINIEECKACDRCILACPKEVLKMSSEINDRGYHYVEYGGEGCNGCANCYYTCPEPLAIEVHIPKKPHNSKLSDDDMDNTKTNENVEEED
jgi:2-oxoisovalerate ferredoxin oxidoreductase delta subunit